jgi:2',3'-cyclic-nucleotide 2'-phosphodiesterase (5'-nucleotidase family)
MGYENDEDDLPESVRECVDNEQVYHIQLPLDVVYAFGNAVISTLDGKQTIQEALAEVDNYRQNGSQETEYEQTLVGSLAQDLLCTNYDVRREETALGDLVADAVAEYAGTDLAVVNGGGIRGSLYAGDVYGADLEAVCPYGNHIVVLEVTGSVIRAMLENGISLTNREDIPGGRFLQVSGLRYSYTPATDDASAQLLSLTLADGTELENSQTYRIAVNNYMAGSYGYLENNGDGYTMLNVYSDDVPKAEGVRLIRNTEATYADALEVYFANHQADTITAGIEGRITVVAEG